MQTGLTTSANLLFQLPLVSSILSIGLHTQVLMSFTMDERIHCTTIPSVPLFPVGDCKTWTGIIASVISISASFLLMFICTDLCTVPSSFLLILWYYGTVCKFSTFGSTVTDCKGEALMHFVKIVVIWIAETREVPYSTMKIILIALAADWAQQQLQLDPYWSQQCFMHKLYNMCMHAAT